MWDNVMRIFDEMVNYTKEKVNRIIFFVKIHDKRIYLNQSFFIIDYRFIKLLLSDGSFIIIEFMLKQS